eukprot:TRINITY_DN26817_c0_g1_i1.p1 TRINITY_DN26817_c0_g1~~TRINITY_DN26817_c0_g1_i1.p1  ORF type:complete len:469 (-),score=41.15 TRINITY_DN26817_c0_g1_i1:380-1786(-)
MGAHCAAAATASPHAELDLVLGAVPSERKLDDTCDVTGKLEAVSTPVAASKLESSEADYKECPPVPKTRHVLTEEQETSGSYAPPLVVSRLVGDGVCAICLAPLVGQAQTIALCGHIFHRSCLNTCGSSKCPQCRRPMDAVEERTSVRRSRNSSRESTGRYVELRGLREMPQYNGQIGELLYDRLGAPDGMKQVRLPCGTRVYVARHNMRPAECPVSRRDVTNGSGPGLLPSTDAAASGATRPITVNEFLSRAKRCLEEGAEVSRAELHAYARHLGISTSLDGDLIWIAEESLKAPPPAEWSEHHDNSDRIFYYNSATTTSSWTHPLESMHRDANRCIASLRRPVRPREELQACLEESERKCTEIQRAARNEEELWSQHFDEQGRAFFFNRRLRVSSWTDPRLAGRHTAKLQTRVLQELHIQAEALGLRRSLASSESDADVSRDQQFPASASSGERAEGTQRLLKMSL